MKFLLLYVSTLLAPIDYCHQIADPICPCDIPSEENQQIIDQLHDAAKKEFQAFGTQSISAPEIGICKRIILLIDPKSQTFEEIINPEIVWRDETNSNHILISGYDRMCTILSKEFNDPETSLFEMALNRLDGK